MVHPQLETYGVDARRRTVADRKVPPSGSEGTLWSAGVQFAALYNNVCVLFAFGCWVQECSFVANVRIIVIGLVFLQHVFLEGEGS